MIFNSIRARLQIWYGLILVVILAGFGFTAWQLQRGHLMGRVNHEMERRASFLAGTFHHRPNGPGQGGRPFDHPPPGEFPDDEPRDEMSPPHENLRLPPETAGLFDAGDPNNFYFIINAHDGQELRRSTNAPAQPLAAVDPAPPRPTDNLHGPHARPSQIVGERMEMEQTMPLGETIYVGCTLAPELKELQIVAFKLTLVGGVILLLGLTGGWWLASRAIRPIEDISATAVKIAGGDLSQRINLAETESELGRLAAVLNSTFARLETAFNQQKQFTSDAAHELRTPVSVMLTQAQTSLNRERSPAEYRQTIEACQRAAQRMRRLIESLLALARLDAGQEPMKHLNFNLAEMIQECVELIRPLAEERGITLTLDLKPVTCVGDAQRLSQVLTNLLTNAIHYNRPNGGVSVSAGVSNEAVIIIVRDTGPGIAPEDLSHVFERFYRSDKSRTTGGTGLGLSICKAIVDAHHGSLTVSSEVGVGTTFAISLPAR